MTLEQAMNNLGSEYPVWVQWAGWIAARALCIVCVLTIITWVGLSIITVL